MLSLVFGWGSNVTAMSFQALPVWVCMHDSLHPAQVTQIAEDYPDSCPVQVSEKGGIFKSAAVRVLQEERRLMTTGASPCSSHIFPAA